MYLRRARATPIASILADHAHFLADSAKRALQSAKPRGGVRMNVQCSYFPSNVRGACSIRAVANASRFCLRLLWSLGCAMGERKLCSRKSEKGDALAFIIEGRLTSYDWERGFDRWTTYDAFRTDQKTFVEVI